MRAHVSQVMIVGALVLMCLGLDHPIAAAQTDALIGERVRVDLLDSGQTEGVVTNWGEQNLSLRTDANAAWTSSWANVAGVEQLRTRRQTSKGLGLGLLIGGLGTGLVAAIAIEPCDGTGFCIGPESRGETAFWFGLAGAALGGAIGTIVGTMVQTSSWEPLAFPGSSSASLGIRWRVPH